MSSEETPRDICHFCAHHVAMVTVTRTHPEVPSTMRLCQRCAYVHQVIVQVDALELVMPGPPCLLCGRLSQATAESRDSSGRLLGRFAVCSGCVGRQEFGIDAVLRQCTTWSPGILELPPPRDRVFPSPPSGGPPSRN